MMGFGHCCHILHDKIHKILIVKTENDTYLTCIGNCDVSSKAHSFCNNVYSTEEFIKTTLSKTD